MVNKEYDLNDIVEMKKEHPCHRNQIRLSVQPHSIFATCCARSFPRRRSSLPPDRGFRSGSCR